MTYEREEFLSTLLRQATDAGYIQAETFFEYGRSTETQILSGEVSMFESSNLQGVSFRGLLHGQMGYAFAEELTDESIAFLLAQAEQNCSVLELEEDETVYKGDPLYQVVDVFSETMDQLGFDAFSKIGLELERTILASDARIIAVDHCIISYGSSVSQIHNSLGLDVKHQSNLLFVYADARCEEDGQVKTGDAYWYGRDMSLLDISDLAGKVSANTVGKLGAATVPSGKYTIVLDAMASADLLATFSEIFSADLIQKGFSLLGDKMNTRIASECVTIHDDAVMTRSITSIPFDSEGVATKNKTLVDKGMLVSILHNRKTAAKAGTQSTGNGFRSGYKGSVSIGSTNFYIEPGQMERQALLAEAGQGLYIKELSGLHSGTNTVSGDFSLSCEGYIIENGIIGRPVDQITIADNFFLFMQKIVAVGSDLIFSTPSESGSIGSPSLLIRDVAVSGE